jgi:hypothetical protein
MALRSARDGRPLRDEFDGWMMGARGFDRFGRLEDSAVDRPTTV